jgi:hypothetical protein
MTQAKTVQKMHVNVQLLGEEVDRFLRFKEKHFLRNASEAGRKLMLERLEQEGVDSSAPTNGARSKR